MSSQSRNLFRFHQLFLILLMAIVQSTRAQEPQSQPLVNETPDPNGDKDKQNASVGKSKLEKETGTVNDRIFEVLPNYGTVEAAGELPPISSGQKFRLATAGVF